MLCDELSDDRALEAINLLAGSELAALDDEEVHAAVAEALGIDATALDTTLRAANAHETAELARVVLATYEAAGEDASVAEAVDETGKKAMLLEVTIIGLLAVGLLHTLITRGRREVLTESTVTIAADGEVTVKTSETVRNYSVGEALAPFAEKLLSAARPGSSAS